MRDESNGIPVPIQDEVIIPRTKSDNMTQPMRLLEHAVVRAEGPPAMPDQWDEDTEVDVIVVDLELAS